MNNVTKIDGTPFATTAPMTLAEALQADAPQYDELMDGDVGALLNELYAMDMDEEANLVDQIVWKLVNANIRKNYS